MKTTKITFERNYHISPVDQYAKERLSIDVELEDGDNVDSAYDYARKKVEENHRKNNPQMFADHSPDYINTDAPIPDFIKNFTKQPTIPVISKDKEKTEIAIDNCTMVGELLELKEDAGRYGLVTHYQKKMNEFQNKK